jgi:capsule polysaccharide export protein KpsE/RkpR
LIVFSTLSAAILVVLFSIYTLRVPPDSPWNPLPNVYRPEVQILIRPSDDGVSSILGAGGGGADLGFLAGLAGVGGIQGPTESALAQSLLVGPEILDNVAEEFDVVEKYGIQEFPVAGSRDVLRERLTSEYDEETGILYIRYEDIDPEYATAVLNRAVTLLETRFRQLTMERVVRKRRFLEDRLAEVEEDIREAQAALVEFQRTYGVIDLESQAEQTISQIATLQNNIFQDQLEIQTLREYLPADAPQIQRLERQIELNREVIRELRTGFLDLSGQGIPQDELAQLSTRQANLAADLELQTQIYTVLRQQYEAAKLEEADNSRTLQVIERAEVPERKAYPSRGVISMIVTVAAFFISVFLAFLLEYLATAREDPVESEKLAAIRQSLRRKR